MKTPNQNQPAANPPVPPVNASETSMNRSAVPVATQDRTTQKAKDRWEGEGGATPAKAPPKN